MSEASPATLEAVPGGTAAAGQKFWPHGWWRLMEAKVGVIPLPLFVLAGGLVLALAKTKGGLTNELTVMAVTLAFFGFACGELGKRIPVIGKMGAAAICATFIPSALVYYGLLPDIVVEATTKFYKATGILYLYICCIIVGSIMSMDRRTLIQGFMKIVIPMACAAVAGMVVGTLTGVLVGKSVFETFFFIVLPCMAGGVGEGAIPLSIGFAEIMHQDQGEMFGRIIPMVMMANVVAIMLSGVLGAIGQRRPHLTGNGKLLPGSADDEEVAAKSEASGKGLDVTGLAAAALMAISLYMVGMLGFRVIGLPAPVGMLFVAVIVKLTQAASPSLTEGARTVYKFFQTSVTYPVLFAVGVAITPWERLIAAFALDNIAVIVATVFAVVGTGFLVSRKLGMYPVDAAVVSCTQCGQGGTGDVAILSASNRMQLMPFAQIATRIGGAINVTVSLLVLSRLVA
ncbi:MAG: 2-hydroxycarboxylate transporter family protein [Rubrivivax sp.]